jgi:multidrug efflux pump subunit AcrB
MNFSRRPSSQRASQWALNQNSNRERFNISRLAIAAPWLTIGVWLAIAIAGMLAFSSLKYALFPDITFPVVVVTAQAPTKTASATETGLTVPIEQALQSIAKVDQINASTYPGQAAVSLSFKVGTNLEESSRQVEAAMQRLTLPQDASFKVIPLNLNESAAISYAIASETLALPDLAQWADKQMVPAVTNIPGVLKVSLLGKPEAFKLPVAGAADQQRQALVRFNGQDTLALQVIKKGDANTLEVVNRVEQEITRLRSQFPQVKLTVASTQATYIQKATHSTIEALIEAIILAIVVIFPFLRSWQATLISALAIPASLLGTFIVMSIFGFNLETITLLALALVIGAVVDDAIVDVENISRHIDEGATPKQAALLATNEIGLTVTAATFTAVAVFLPIGLMGGVIGQFFKPFGITVSAAMLMSLLVARTLSPVLSIYWLKPKPARQERNPSTFWLGFTEGYRLLLDWALRHRLIVMGIAVLSFVAGIALIPLIPQGFIPKLDRGEFNIAYTAPLPQRPQMPKMPPGELGQGIDPAQMQAQMQAQMKKFNPLQDSLQVAKQLETQVRQSPEVESVFTIVGSREGEPNKGTLYVKMKGEPQGGIRQGTGATAKLQDQFRQSLPKLAGVTTSIEDIPFVDTGSQKPLQVALQGDDLVSLGKAANDLKAKLQTLPGFVDLTVAGAAQNKDQILQIERKNGQRVAYVNGNLGQNLSLGDATEAVVAAAPQVLPAGVKLNLGGDAERSDLIFRSFGTTLGLSILCIIAVLALLFRSWLDPLVIGLSLPLALVGAMLALLFTQSDFGMISLIGFVFLLGQTNKNAILIVDYINQLRKQGLGRREAILWAGPVRLRPIIMTTAATVLGMLPLALGLGAGSELRSPMAVAIAGGLITSTLLSLIVVPVLYTLFDDLKPQKKVFYSQ